MRLLDVHEKQLKMSGIPKDCAVECGIFSSSVVEDLIKYLNMPAAGLHEPPYLIFPYYNLENRDKVETYSVRFAESEGLENKYLRTKGAPNYLYVPKPLTLEMLNNISKPIIITEGEKKAISGFINGYLTIGIPGINGWRTKYEGQERTTPLSEFDEIILEDRAVYIVFDSDVEEKVEILKAENKLVEFLTDRGSEVYCVRIPRRN